MSLSYKLPECVIVVILLQGLGAGQQKIPSENSRTSKKLALAEDSGEKNVRTRMQSKSDQTSPAGDEQKIALDMLEASEAAIRTFELPLRSYGLLQIAQTYVGIDKTRAEGVLKDAFSASLGIDDSRTKTQIQQEILLTLVPISSDTVEELLPSAEANARQDALQAIIGLYTEKKQFQGALSLVYKVTSWNEFPYGSGSRLMEALPTQMEAEKQELFTEALNSYKRHEHKEVVIGRNTFLGIVVRFGAAMPPKLALQAIDEILTQGKEHEAQSTISISGPGGSTNFNSFYEFQLFALLPLLRQLDETHVQVLLEENQSLQGRLQQFPDGLRSVYPSSTAGASSSETVPSSQTAAVSVATGNDAGSTDYAFQIARLSMQEVARQADTDPAQAIARSVTLPATIAGGQISPRAEALEGIARTNLLKNPGAANQALSEMRKVAGDLPLRLEVQYLAVAGTLYVQMKEQDNAEKSIGEGFKAADKLFDLDTNADDPNTALKAWWPSTDAYRRFLQIQARISNRTVINLLKEIKDPEIRSLESIVFARSLLGSGVKRFIIVEKHKNTNATSVVESN